jgi:hypothetical protein
MKLVCESLDESLSFEKRKDPFAALGIGRKKMIEDWLDEMDVRHYIINDDFTIDTKTGVDLFNRSLKQLPDFIQFNDIHGDFQCHHNKLISLKGCPRYVDDDFMCSYNGLTSLRGCPEYVGCRFYCRGNKKHFAEDYIRSLCDVKIQIINKEN